jgi:hypothetical protein
MPGRAMLHTTRARVWVSKRDKLDVDERGSLAQGSTFWWNGVMTKKRTIPDAPTPRRATPQPATRDDRYYDCDKPGMGDTLSGGDASRAPKSLLESERRAKDDAILAGDDWDNQDEI